MIGRLALRSLTAHPVRSAVLAAASASASP